MGCDDYQLFSASPKAPAVDDIDISEYILIDKRIDECESTALRDRWEFGWRMLRERVGGRLPNNRLAELSKATHKSQTELKYRAAFADAYQTEDELANALASFDSWRELVKTLTKNPRDGNDTDLSDIDGELEPAEPGWHQLGPHWLYCGDSTDQDFINRCAGAAFAFADPPYNAEKADWDREFTWNHDYLTDTANVAAVTPGIASLQQFLRQTAMPYLWCIAAEITNSLTRGAIGYGNWIAVPLFSHGSIYRQAQDHIAIATVVNHETDAGAHPSRKPLRLLRALVDTFTEPDETVIDPFLGSGTTLIAANQLRRRCIGAEIDPLYCAEIIARWESQ